MRRTSSRYPTRYISSGASKGTPELGVDILNNRPLTHHLEQTRWTQPTLVTYLDDKNAFRMYLDNCSETLVKMKNDQNPPLNLDFCVKLVQVPMQTPGTRGDGRPACLYYVCDQLHQCRCPGILANVVQFNISTITGDNVFAPNYVMLGGR